MAHEIQVLSSGCAAASALEGDVGALLVRSVSRPAVVLTLPETTVLVEWLQAAFGVAAAIIVSLGGAGAIILALSNWLGRVWAQRILEADRAKYRDEIERQKAQYQQELERLRSSLAETVHVTRAQFEIEFSALQRVWSALSELRNCMETIRPETDIARPGETWTDKLSERLPPFLKAFNELLTVSRELKPWYPAEIHSAVRVAIGAANVEGIQLRTEHPDSPGNQSIEAEQRWYASGRENNAKVADACEKVEQLMRERLARLAIRSD